MSPTAKKMVIYNKKNPSRKNYEKSKKIMYKKSRKNPTFIIHMERVRRIELPTTAWKAVVLPLNYTRIMIS